VQGPDSPGRPRAGRLLLGTSLLALVCGAAGAASASEQQYVVRRGDWLLRIAEHEHVSLRRLAAANQLAAPYRLRAGQKLLLAPDDSGPILASAAQHAAIPAMSPHARLAATANAAAADASALAQGSPTGPSPVARPGPAQPGTTPTTSPVVPIPQPEPLPTPRSQHPISLILPLYDDQTYVGDIDAVVTPEGAVSVTGSELLDFAKNLVSEQTYAKLGGALQGKANVRLEEISSDGLKATYDGAQLRIVLTIPGADRGRQSLKLADLDHRLVGDVAKPEAYSGYLNIHSSADYVEAGQSDRGFADPTVLLNAAIRLNGPVLEADAQYAPGQQGTSAFSRQDTRLVYDYQPWFARFTGGDLDVTGRSFQGGVQLAGLSIERLYSTLAPQDNIQPRGNQSFTLERASTVQTVINGRTVQQIRLGPGVYNLSDFPFAQGANNVQLLIQDDTGQRQALNFSIFFDRSLLKPGLTEFGLYSGVETLAAGGNVDYTDEGAVTGFIRHGFNDWLTAGLNFQGDSRVQMGGVESLWGTKLGSIGADLAVSNAQNYGSGYAINLGYDLLQQSGNAEKSQSLTATLQYRSRAFATLGQLSNNITVTTPTTAIGPVAPGTPTATGPATPLNTNPYQLQAALNYNRSFGDYSFVGANVSYSIGRDGTADLGQFQVSYGREFTRDSNAVINLEYDTTGVSKGFSVRLSLTKRFGKTGSIRADYDSAQELGQVTYQDSHGRGVGAWNASATVDGGASQLGFNGDLDYTANRGEFGLAQSTSYDVTGHTITDVRSTARFDTAIAFTGGHFAIGQPIYDSFAILAPHSTLGGAPVVVDPSPDGDLAISGALGDALLSDIGSYSVRTITYDVPKAPAGYDIGSGSLRVLSPYKAGYFVEVGSDYSVTVIGRLVGPDGVPISLLAGRAIEEAHPERKAVILFTSRDGRFAAEGLRPGKWRIEMPTTPGTDFEIDVPKAAASLLKVGDLHGVEATGSGQ